jgi:cyclic nucleotide gated channel
MKFIDCGHGNDFGDFLSDTNWGNWTKNEIASACFTEDGFSYGIYIKAVNLTTKRSIITRYTYSLFWGFQVLLLSISSFFLYLDI